MGALTFMPDTSPVESGLVNVGPFPPVVTVSTKVRIPSATENDWRLPTGDISLTALYTHVQNTFGCHRIGTH